jgi:hypothetical protein
LKSRVVLAGARLWAQLVVSTSSCKSLPAPRLVARNR